MDYAFLSQIQIRENISNPLYVQLRDGFRNIITTGILKAGHKLPSSRILSDYFNVHRQTIVAAMDELIAEGWIKSKGRKGLYVNDKLPVVKPIALGSKVKQYPSQVSFAYKKTAVPLPAAKPFLIGFNDGLPDIRLAPLKELAKAYSQALQEKSKVTRLAKRDPVYGSTLLRTELAELMQQYRGLNITASNILITKGSQMSIFLVTSLLVQKGDNIIVTDPNYQTANYCFRQLGAKLLKVSIDNEGMNVDDVERLCRRKKIRMLYVTSHHHHPTTVALSIERRLRLLQLAEQYGFVILEDDYDYDFHYAHRPLMPIASNDTNGHVIYIGSFSKILSPNFRTGYIIAPPDIIDDLACFKRMIDGQPDPFLETAIGKLLRDGTMKNHVKKALNIYRERRDYAYELFSSLPENMISFQKPAGGLAFWILFNERISLSKLSQYCTSQNIFFHDGTFYNAESTGQNGCRLGFASITIKEMDMCFNILNDGIKLQLK